MLRSGVVLEELVDLKDPTKGICAIKTWDIQFQSLRGGGVARDGVAVEDEGEGKEASGGASLWIYSPSFRVMVCKVSLNDNWWVLSLAMASSKLSKETFDLVDSTIEEQREHQIC